jgi:DNA-binding PadR family transcriptional regulator
VSENLKLPTGKEMAVLELLIGGREMYGLELVKASEGLLKRGTIYVLLDRMEQKGLVSSREGDRDATASGLPRRRYRICGQGRLAYQAWHSTRRLLAGVPAMKGAST